MNRLRLGMALALAGLLVTAAAAGADVKSTSKAQMKFEGMLGRMMGMFGGKAVKERGATLLTSSQCTSNGSLRELALTLTPAPVACT